MLSAVSYCVAPALSSVEVFDALRPLLGSELELCDELVSRVELLMEVDVSLHSFRSLRYCFCFVASAADAWSLMMFLAEGLWAARKVRNKVQGTQPDRRTPATVQPTFPLGEKLHWLELKAEQTHWVRSVRQAVLTVGRVPLRVLLSATECWDVAVSEVSRLSLV